VLVRVPYSWMFRRMCWVYADWGSLFFMYLMCSLYLMDRLRLVWPVYALLQVFRRCRFCCGRLSFHGVCCCTVFVLLKAILVSVCLKRLVIFLTL
jgi:hypothetical protein